MDLYPVGKHIRVADVYENQVWYVPDIFMVIGYSINVNNEIIYKIDRYLHNNDGLVDKMVNEIHYSLICSDEECLKLDRKLKLAQLNG